MAGRVYGYITDPDEYYSVDGSSQLRIKILNGKNLAKKDIFGASDPYVRIDLISVMGDVVIDTALSKTKKKTLNPIWEEEFVFRVKPLAHKIVIQVFDENRLTRDDFLGMVELTLFHLPKEQEGRVIPSKVYQLRPRRSVRAKSKVCGTLELYHAYIRDLDADASLTENEYEEINNGEASPTTNAFETSENNDVLPPGWEERQDANGRTFYVHHITKTTQWNRPTNSNDNFRQSTSSTMNSTIQRRFHISADSGTSSQDDGLGNEILRLSLNNVQSSTPNGSPLTENDRNSSNSSLTSIPVRPAPAPPSIPTTPTSTIQRASHRRRAPNPPSSERNSENGTNDDNEQSVVNLDSSSTHSPEISRSSSQNENEDVDTSDGSSNSASNLGATASPQSRQDSLEDNSSSSQTEDDPEAGLPPGWSMQIAPNGRVFFIDHNERQTSWVDPRTGRASPMPNTEAPRKVEDDLGPLPEGWEERVHTDGRVFYIDHHNRKTQWDDPRLLNPSIAGQAVPYSRDYKQKYEYFKSHLKKPTNVPNKFEIKIRRTSILEDSYRIISSVTKTDLLKTKLWIEFENEVGLDYGGLSREWFFELSKEMFNPYYGLYEYSAMDNYTLQINPFSGLCNEEHLSYFRFIGRVAGMAVYHGKLLDAFFIRPFYKMMLQKPIDLRDMESVDMEYYNSLLWIKENDPSELMLTFCVDEDTFGQTSQRELKTNGANIEVTNDNKDEYIRLVIEWRFVSRVKQQMGAFLEGFGSIVSLPLLKIFDENELELLMCGIQNIDVNDWKTNTLYKGDYHGNHLIIQWFWKAVLSFTNETRSRLLQFVTGTSRVPMNGFKELYGSNGPQMFTIERWGAPENFPRAHTCFNRLDLPPYTSYPMLKEKLLRAIEGSQGFAGVD